MQRPCTRDTCEYLAAIRLAEFGLQECTTLLHSLPRVTKLPAWEAKNDSGGVSLPRAKCHNDRTIVLISTFEELPRTLRALTEARDEHVEHQT